MSEQTVSGKIGRISLAVEIDGKPHFVALQQDRLRILVQLAASLSDNEKLVVAPAPEGFHFTTMATEAPQP